MMTDRQLAALLTMYSRRIETALREVDVSILDHPKRDALTDPFWTIIAELDDMATILLALHPSSSPSNATSAPPGVS